MELCNFHRAVTLQGPDLASGNSLWLPFKYSGSIITNYLWENLGTLVGISLWCWLFSVNPPRLLGIPKMDDSRGLVKDTAWELRGKERKSCVPERSSSCDWLPSHLSVMSRWLTSHMESVLKETSTPVLDHGIWLNVKLRWESGIQ